MRNAIELFIIEDQPVYANALKNLFNRKTDNIYVGGIAHTLDAARRKLIISKPDIILLDLILENEISAELCIELKDSYPDLKVIVLTGSKDAFLLQQVWWNGADAIISKLFDKEEFIDTINSVMKGKTILGSKLPPIHDKHVKTRDKLFLTKRENQIINLLLNGNKRKVAAEILNISIETVNKHCTNIFHKFEVDNLSSFSKKARENKLIP